MLKVALLTVVIGWADSSPLTPPMPTSNTIVFEGQSASARCLKEEERVHVKGYSFEGDWKVTTDSVSKRTFTTTKTLCVQLTE